MDTLPQDEMPSDEKLSMYKEVSRECKEVNAQWDSWNKEMDQLERLEASLDDPNRVGLDMC